MQQPLYAALIGLARALAGYCTPDAQTWQTLLQALNGQGTPEELLQRVREEKRRMAPDCAVCTHPCGRTADADAAALANEPEPVRLAKQRLWADLQRYAAQKPDCTRPEIQQRLVKCLFVLGEPFAPEELEAVRQEELAAQAEAV